MTSTFIVGVPSEEAVAEAIGCADEGTITPEDSIGFLKNGVLQRQSASGIKESLKLGSVIFQASEPENAYAGQLWINNRMEMHFYGRQTIVGLNLARSSASEFKFFDASGEAAEHGFTMPTSLQGAGATTICVHVLADNRLFTLDSEADQVVISDLDGSNASALPLVADQNTIDPLAMAVNATRYCVIYRNRNVRFYDHSGARQSSEDFTLHADNVSPAGAAAFNGKLYVADSSENKVFCYNADGTRHSAGDITVSVTWTSNFVTVHNDHLYLKGEAYDADLNRASDFDVTFPSGTARGSFMFTDPLTRWLTVGSS